MGCCISRGDLYEKHLERQRLLGTNYSKLMESSRENDVDISDCAYVFREAMDSKYEYMSVDINKYKCVDISVDNGQYLINMVWKVINGKLSLLNISHDRTNVISDNELRILISQKITLDDLIDSYFEYINGRSRSMLDIVKTKAVKITKK